MAQLPQDPPGITRIAKPLPDPGGHRCEVGQSDTPIRQGRRGGPHHPIQHVGVVGQQVVALVLDFVQQFSLFAVLLQLLHMKDQQPLGHVLSAKLRSPGRKGQKRAWHVGDDRVGGVQLGVC